MNTTGHLRRAFTLIEVLLAMSVGLLVLILALSMLSRTRVESARLDESVAADRDARAVITQLSADLQSALFHPDSLFEQNHAPWPADRLGIFSLQAPDAQARAEHLGDLCAIHYYLKDQLISGKTVRCLMRGFRPSSETFQALRLENAPSLFTCAKRDDTLAFGIISFEARPQICNPAGQWQAWQPVMTQAPAALAIRLVIARRELTAKLTHTTAWNGDGAARRLLGMPSMALSNRHLEVYTAIIRYGHPALTETRL
ncbi:MAG: prepilin-type N-terminal cleavage/methylation domain-containing protein [Verrucomicrobiota bacterium]